MGFLGGIGRLIGSGARIGLGFATGGPTGAAAAGLREIGRRRSRRQRRRDRRRARRQQGDPRLGPQFQPRPAPLVDTRMRTRTGQLIDVLGGGGGFGGAGAGGRFGPPARGLPAAGGVTVRGIDVSSGAVAMVPATRTVVMPRPGFVTVTLPIQMFGFAAGSKIQMMKEIAVKFGLWKRPRKPLLSAGDLDALRRATRVERKLVGLTDRHTDFKCVSKASRARASARVSSRKR